MHNEISVFLFNNFFADDFSLLSREAHLLLLLL